LHAAPARVHRLGPGLRGLRDCGRALRAEGFTHAVMVPNSPRSAISPFLAGIPRRRGTAYGLRRALVNDRVDLSDLAGQHQQWEMARLLLGEDVPASLPPPRLRFPPAALAAAGELLAGLSFPVLGLIPGAARGPAKRWPGDRFLAVARGFLENGGGAVCWLGTAEDVELCGGLHAALPPERSRILAGRTGLDVFAAVLGTVDAVLANDSGGMHLAAAADTPVVAVFGVTDPAKTGPLHPRAVVLQHATARSRKVGRDSAEARAALAAVGTAEVLERVLAIPPRSR